MHDSLSAEYGQTIVQLPRRFARANRGECLQHHRSGVEPGLHLHDRDARFGVPRKDGAMNRRGAAPARQQRGVNIQATKAPHFVRNVEHRLRQNQPVSSHHQHIGVKRCEFGPRLGRFEVGRLEYGNAGG